MRSLRSPIATNVIAILALLVSVVALAFSYQQYRDMLAFRKTPLLIRVGAENQNIVFFRQPKNSHQIMFRQRYRVILTNNSFNPESILDARIMQVRGGQQAWYPGMDPKFLDDLKAPLRMPFMIAPKESKVIFIDIGQQVPEQSWAAVKTRFSLGKELDWNQSQQIFALAGHPYFGQFSLEKSSFNEQVSVDQYGGGENYQEFELRFTKSQGNEISAEISLAISDTLAQGEADD